MKGVAEDNVRTDFLNIARQHALDGAVGTHRHKGRCFHHTARENQAATTGATGSGIQFKLHKTSAAHDGVSGLLAVGLDDWGSSATAAGFRVINMASP